jgi:hypothetical protein
MILFCVHHPVNWDDQHLFAEAMASDFSVAWKFFSEKKCFFLVRIASKILSENFLAEMEIPEMGTRSGR